MSAQLAFWQGFLTGGGLIIAIGAQNAYVLTQGLHRNYPGTIATTCFLIDALLIAAGVAGMGALVQSSELALQGITLAGALFLTAYGLRAAHAALQGGALGRSSERPVSRKSAVMICLALSLLNPHVYLDTVVLLGSIGGALPEGMPPWFVAGACLASFVWFYSLAFGAARLAPLLAKESAWRALDGLIALIMFGIAGALWVRFISTLTTS